MPGHIAERRDDKYILNFFAGETIDDLIQRLSVDVDNFDPKFGVGDVTKLPDRLRENTIDEFEDEEIANKIKDEYNTVENKVEEAARKYGVDLDRDSDRFSAGEAILLASPPNCEEVGVEPGDTIFAMPEGFLKDELWKPVPYSYLIQCPSSAIEPGFFFDVFKIDDFLLGLEYDADATKNAKEESVEVVFDHARSIEDLVNVDSEDDIVPPLYVNFTEYDEGIYRASLYDSETSSSDSLYSNYRCVDDRGYALPTYRVKKEWPYGCGPLVPVSSLTIDNSADPQNVAVSISRDGNAIKYD